MARVLISGASGLIGRALVIELGRTGHTVHKLVRRASRNQQEIEWDPMRAVPPQLVAGFDTVIHLSGESVSGRWTEGKKKRIRQSRVVSTRNLAEALAQAAEPPTSFICASAVGYYGNRGDEELTEASPPGSGFLAEVCREWETATEAAAAAGIRTANLRIGIVLSRDGGALKQMLLPFRLGLGGRFGSGRQWWSWIHIDDLVAAVMHIVGASSNVEGRAPSPGQGITEPVNLVAPNPVTNVEFTHALAKALKRPPLFPVPAFAARLAFGEFADGGLLASARVFPRRLQDSKFMFHFADLSGALAALVS